MMRTLAGSIRSVYADPAGRRRLRIGLRKIGAVRIVATGLFLILAILFARGSWAIPLAVDAERTLYDVRVVITAPRVAQDDRIVLVTYTPETLEATGRRSPLDRGLLAAALTNLDRLGARAIGIDILIDQPQPEDPALLKALAGMRTPVRLAFADATSNPDSMAHWQERFLRDFMGRLRGSFVRPASIRLEDDPDGVMRSWPRRPPHPPLMANALAPPDATFADYDRAIAYRLPLDPERPIFTSLPIDLFASEAGAAMLGQAISGRYVLIGGDIPDLDEFDTPATRLTGARTKGLEIHATLLAQQLDGIMLVPLPRASLWALAVLVVTAGALTSLSEMRSRWLVLILLGQAALFVGLPFLLELHGTDTQGLPAFGWIGGWILAYIAVGTAALGLGSQERRFAQAALGKYLPPDVAREIIADPERLALHGERRAIYAVFTDMEGFTRLTHAIPAELTAELLNRYLDALSSVVLAHGGTIDKFVGDALVSFWGAPIARADDAERVAHAVVALMAAGEAFRASAPASVPALGCTRIGLHHGDAVVGNFGGEGRISYTALGDAMNTAARLENANKQLGTIAIVSAEARARIGLPWFRPMGCIGLRGRSTPVDVFEPVPDLAAEVLATHVDAYRRFAEGDLSGLDDLARLAQARAEDAALHKLVERLRTTGPGGCYVLD